MYFLSIIPTESPFFTWLMDMLRAIAGMRSGFGDAAMQGITKLGHEALFVVVACTLLYCVNKKLGYKFLFMFSLGQFLNQAFKVIFAVPRPWVIDPEFKAVDAALPDATGWSFPSGHTQSAVMMYGYTARVIKRWWAYLGASALILLIGFSRMYLGVHTLLDVAAALVLGLATIIASELLFGVFGEKKHFVPVFAGIISFVLLAYLIIILIFDKGSMLYLDDVSIASTLFGLAFGFFCGSIVEQRFVNYDVKAVWWVQIIKVALGLGMMLLLRFVLKKLFGLIADDTTTLGNLLDGLRYFLMIFFGLAVYPLSFPILTKLDRKGEAKRKAKAGA